MTDVTSVARAVRGVWRFAKTGTPSWLLPIPPGDLAIPGPIDGAAIMAATLVRLARSRQARAELAALVSAALGTDGAAR